MCVAPCSFESWKKSVVENGALLLTTELSLRDDERDEDDDE